MIEQAGRPALAGVPYDEFMAKFSEPMEQGLIPHDIVVRHTENDVPLVKCWREHLGMTQAELARVSGVQQPPIARIESSIDYMPRKTTLEKLAKAMRISLDQLLVE